jgi:uncharacterized membrane protein/thiol-disulfide isomerase/thioredoxin
MARTFTTGLKKVVGSYIRQLNANVTTVSVEKDIEINPHYPSLLSLSETFSRYHINNSAFNLTHDEVLQVATPFVAFVNIPGTGRDFVLVEEIEDKLVKYQYNTRRSKWASKEEFLKQYLGIIWLAEADRSSGEVNFQAKVKHLKLRKALRLAWIFGTALLVLLFVGTAYSRLSPLGFCSIALIKMVGLATSLLLLAYEIDKSNPFVRSLCIVGGRSNCDAVLNSKGSKIAGITWSEIGFFYFAATEIYLLYPSIDFNSRIAISALANIFAAPYVIYSVYYQSRIIKQWCPLCLTVQGMLLLELLWSWFMFWSLPAHAINGMFSAYPNLAAIGISLLIPVLTWAGLKPLLLTSRSEEAFEAAYKRMQYNPDLFNGLLLQQEIAPDGWQNLGIRFGDPDARNVILKVCNPYCGPCAEAHPILEELVAMNPNVQVRIIFTTRSEEKDRGARITKHLMAISSEGDPDKTKNALNDWYLAEKKDYKAFAKKYPIHGELQQQALKLELMSTWCKDANITFTPTIYVNGHRLPELYNADELKNIL